MDVDLADLEWNTSKTVDAIRELESLLSSINSKIEDIKQNTEEKTNDFSVEYLWELKEMNRHLKMLVIDQPSTFSVIALVGVWSIIFKVLSHFIG